eukprot:scaffold133_cov169-Amphora_coffeaeformis.AAC.3
MSMEGDEQPCQIAKKSRLVPTTKMTEAPRSSNLSWTSPLSLVLETLPFTKTPNSSENLFADPCLPMQTHRADLLESVLEKSVRLDDVFSIGSYRAFPEQRIQGSKSESFGWADRESSSP